MQKQNRLGQSRQFNYVYRRGKKASCKEMSLLYVRNKDKRVGFSVSKKVGVAVVRNRTKRRLRESVRPLLPQMKSGLYVFVARPAAAECSFQELNAKVKYLLRKVEALRAPAEETRPAAAGAHRQTNGKSASQPETGVFPSNPQ